MDVERYRMRFVPYDPETGRLKRNCPQPGVKGCVDDGDIVELPLEQRWETWWELADDADVPEDVLARDQKERDAFMVKAKAAEVEREKLLRAVGSAVVPVA